MTKGRLIILGFISTVFMSTGCGETQASSNSDIKAVALDDVAKEVQLRGKFKRSFEVHELVSNGVTYYVSDPQQLLMKDSKVSIKKAIINISRRASLVTSALSVNMVL